ncbi:MAG: alkaline phosphatase D family protein [Mycobacteriales bacterium]
MTGQPTRRSVLRGGIVVGAGVAGASLGAARPAAAALVRRGRPAFTHGIQSGDVGARDGIVWARADRPARMIVEVSGRPDLRGARRVRGPILTPDTDLTGKTWVRDLEPGRDVYYRVVLADLADPSLTSAPLAGTFRTAPVRRAGVRFVWSGDLAGQGYGINPDFGGFVAFDAIRALRPDFYLHNGDTIYADDPIEATVTTPDGRTWRNLVTEGKSVVAQSLDGYRENYRYNLLDEPLRRFAAEIAQVNQWDDHEVHNNWYPGEILEDPNYTEKRVDVLRVYAARAFHEYVPIEPFRSDPDRVYRKRSYGPSLDLFALDMRAYRDPNGPDDYTVPTGGIFGRRQVEWLKRELLASRATWKVISNDMPLGLVVPDGPRIEAVAQGRPGAPLGRELDLADILSFIRRHRIRNVVWLTTDVHYTAAIRYSPDTPGAGFQDFDPFWEFVSGPIHAGSFGPNKLDTTFGPRVVWQKTPPYANASPFDGYQFFGEAAIEGDTGVLTVNLRDLHGSVLWTIDLDPEG